MQMASWWFAEDPEIKSLKKKMDDLQKENEALQERVDTLEEKIKSLEMEEEIKQRVAKSLEERLPVNKRGVDEDHSGSSKRRR